jgi:hypothetical protein
MVGGAVGFVKQQGARRARLNRRRHLPSRSHSRFDVASSSGIAACTAARIAR